jgi:hypothetical protein
MVHTYNPRTQEAEIGGFALNYIVRPISKTKQNQQSKVGCKVFVPKTHLKILYEPRELTSDARKINGNP